MCSRVFKYDNYSKTVVDAWTKAKLSSVERIRVDKDNAMKRYTKKIKEEKICRIQVNKKAIDSREK